MGDIYAESAEKPDAAIVIPGDFCFFAGEPSDELVAYKPMDFKKIFIVMVPLNQAWAEVIETHYGKKAEKTIRYAIHKNRGTFNKEKPEQAVAQLPEPLPTPLTKAVLKSNLSPGRTTAVKVWQRN